MNSSCRLKHLTEVLRGQMGDKNAITRVVVDFSGVGLHC